MSWSMRASILIALQDRRGEWCTPAWIAERVVASVDSVLPFCEELVLANLIQFKLGDGMALFGVDVTAEFPAINDASEEAAL